VLVAGGYNPNQDPTVTELYDVASGTWTNTGSLHVRREGHTATLLPNGKVLVAGGFDDFLAPTNEAELYDPASGNWSITGSMNAIRWQHTATLLPNGRVLVAGGQSTNFAGTTLAEVYDPATGFWTRVLPANREHQQHTATLLPNGTVLVAGSFLGQFGASSDEEIYDPTSQTWTLLTLPKRYSHTMTLLPSGKLLMTGGSVAPAGATNLDNLFDVGLGYTNATQPQLASVTSPLNLSNRLAMTGSQFRPLAEASGGNGGQSSASDYPVVQLLGIGNEQTLYLSSTNSQTNSYVSFPVTNFPPGYALATMFVNGTPSTSSIIRIGPTPVATRLSNLAVTNGTVQFGFTNTPGGIFNVLATTNVSLPASNWTVLGNVLETADGQFHFSDAQAGSFPRRFYRVISP